MRTKIAILLCLFSFPFLAAAQDNAKPVTVPFTFIETGHFMVKAKLNDKGPYNLIFDTGAPVSLINNRLAKEAGIAVGGGFSLFGAMNPGQTIKKLEIGSLVADKVATMVIDHPTVSAFSRFYKDKHGEPIDGIVGFPFFSRYATTVNYQTKELTFTPNGYQPTDVVQGLMNKMMASQGKQDPKTLTPQGYWGMTFAAKKDDDAGVVIEKIFPDSPAAKAGLQPGDRLLTLDGRWTDSISDAYAATSFVPVGKAVEVVSLREGKETMRSIAPVAGF